MIINLIDENYMTLNEYGFRINTNFFKIHYKINSHSINSFPHTGIVLRNGIHVIYKHPTRDVWANINTYVNTNTVNVNMKPILDNNIEYEVIIYPPLLSELQELKIELDDEYVIEKIEFKKDILIIGGKNSLGIGCTTSSMTFPNILGRRVNASITRVVSNSTNFIKENYESYMNMKLPKINIAIIELNQIKDDDLDYLKNIIDTLSKKCDKIIGWYFPDKKPSKKVNDYLKNEIRTKKFILEDFSFMNTLENREMCYLNDDIINDAGNVLIFKKLLSTIDEAI